MGTVATTEAQQAAIDAQAAVYGVSTECVGLDHYTIERASDWEVDAADAVAAVFHYITAERDGLGLEVTIFAADGSVLDSQDFG